jgi:exosortase
MSSDSTGLRRYLPPPTPLTFAAVAALLVLFWVFWPTLAIMADRWSGDPRYSHGYLVPLFSLYLLWWRRASLDIAACKPDWLGLGLLLAGLAMRFSGTYFYFEWLRAGAILPCVAGLVMLVGGRPALRWSWPAILFLIFMVPLPFRVEVALAHPLQRIATQASAFALQTLGFVAIPSGNTIRMGPVRLGVVEACSGLSMLVIFFALSTAVAILIRRPLYERIAVFLSAAPIALFANIARITVTGVLHKTVGPEIADRVFHDLAGWLMMPLALGMMWLELRVFRWIVVQRPRRWTEAPGVRFGYRPPIIRTPAAPAAGTAPQASAAASNSSPATAGGPAPEPAPNTEGQEA